MPLQQRPGRYVGQRHSPTLQAAASNELFMTRRHVEKATDRQTTRDQRDRDGTDGHLANEAHGRLDLCDFYRVRRCPRLSRR